MSSIYFPFKFSISNKLTTVVTIQRFFKSWDNKLGVAVVHRQYLDIVIFVNSRAVHIFVVVITTNNCTSGNL